MNVEKPLVSAGGAPLGNQNAKKADPLNKHINLQLTKMQKKQYRVAAAKAGKSVNEWIRDELDSVILLS